MRPARPTANARDPEAAASRREAAPRPPPIEDQEPPASAESEKAPALPAATACCCVAKPTASARPAPTCTTFQVNPPLIVRIRRSPLCTVTRQTNGDAQRTDLASTLPAKTGVTGSHVLPPSTLLSTTSSPTA